MKKIFLFCIFLVSKTIIYAKNFNTQLESKHLGKVATTIVVGSGPAGQASALHLARLGGKVLVLAGEDHGQLDYSSDVENILYAKKASGKNINEFGIEQAQSAGATIINEKVVKIDFSVFPFEISTSKKNVYYAFSIVLTMGASPKKLDSPGFEKYWGKGISSCAKCDGNFYKNKTVAVIGGGDSACEEVIQLSFHAKKIFVLVRSNKMRASSVMQERVKKLKNIEILYETTIEKIKGDENNIKEIAILSKNTTKNIKLDGIFIAIGSHPNTGLVKNFVDLDKNGYILCKNRSQETSLEGVFAAGDICDIRYKQASTAVGDGVKAAIDSFDFLQNIGISKDFILQNEKFWFNLNKNSKVKEQKQKENTKIKKSQIYKLSSEQEFDEIIKNVEYVVLDFYASWCPPCQKMKTTLYEYINLKDSVDVIMIDVDQFPNLAQKFSVSSIPKLFLINNGSIISSIAGYYDLNSFTEWVKGEKHGKKTK